MKKKYFLTLLFSSTIAFAQTQIGNTINGLAAGDQSGYSVALSGNGNIVAIGSPKYNSSRGNVRVFQNSSGIWNQIGEIYGLQANAQSGYSVSLSDDGTVLAVGTPYSGSGSVSVYKKNSNVWTKIGSNINGEAGSNWSGLSVSLSSDGNVVAIGAPGSDSSRGNVRVYRNIGNVWTQVGSDIDGIATYTFSGWSVSLSDDGTTVAVGAFNDGPGAVRIYKNISNVWNQVGAAIYGEASGDQSGESVSLSGDGSVVAIGASHNNSHGNGTYAGRVRIYRNIANTWTQIGADIDGATASRSGGSVSLSNDGSLVAIGASAYNGTDGQAKIFKNISNSWIQAGSDINSASPNDNDGYQVSLSNDGSVVALGAIRADNNNLTDSGHVRIFNLQAILKTDDLVLKNFTISPNPTSDFVNITLQKNMILQKVNIYSTTGQLIKSSTSSKISVQDLSEGNYYFEIITDKGKATKKIIVL
ncbi:MAG: T9SS type A sorting domain-containing protein [Chryseobacterium sp.]